MEALNLEFLSRPRELLSLKNLSTEGAASLLWSSKQMKMAMEKVLDRHYPLWRDHNSSLEMGKPCLEDLSKKISETVFHIFNQAKGQMSLPQVLKIKIEKKVVDRVEEVINWILYLIHDLKLDYKAAERIYWTTDGRIDEDKIFRLCWTDQLAGEPVSWKRFDQNLNLLQYLACFFGQEEFISSHRSEYIGAINLPERENSDIVFTIITTVIGYYNDLNFASSNDLKSVKFQIIDKSTVMMLSICKMFCFYKPFVYLWNCLNATESFNYLETQSKTRSIWRNEATKYATEQSLKIILFLVEQMNETQKYNFILNNFSDVILNFSRNKNCRKFCMPLVEHFFPIINETEKRNLLAICANICNRSNQFDIELEIVKRLVKNEPIPKIFRPDFISFDPNSPFQVVKTFFENFNLSALKIIINDEISESRRKDLISIGTKKFRELIRNYNFQFIDNFLDEVLSSEAEKDKFKQDYNFLGDWINQCRFDIVDNVLIWMHGSASEEFKTPLKNLCCSSIRRDYEEIEKLLIWFFDAHGPLINNCQRELLNEFCCGLIYNLWFPKYNSSQNKLTASEISTKIVAFSFFSEKEIQNFKTNILANEKRLIKFFSEMEWQGYPTWERGRLPALEGLLNFCNLPKEKMVYIRMKVLLEESRVRTPQRQYFLY